MVVLRVASVGVAMVFLVSGCSRGGCEHDADCKGDRVCSDEGRCVLPPPPAPPPPPVVNVPTPVQQQPQEPEPQPVAQPAPQPSPRAAAPAPKPAGPRPTCGACGDDCLNKADSVRKSDPAWATHLASQACTEDCSPGTTTLLHCHSYGLMLQHQPTPRF